MRRLVVLSLVLSAARAYGQANLCAGLPTDRAQHPMRPLAKPAVGVLTKDPDLGGTFRRITNVQAAGKDPFIKPLYSPIAAWNADESYILLYAGAGSGVPGWWIYNGTTYAPIKRVSVSPADVEQLWWDSSDPNIVYWPDAGQHKLMKTNVVTDVRTTVHDFSNICTSFMYGESHAGPSWDTDLFGFACGPGNTAQDRTFSISYRKSTDTVLKVIRRDSNCMAGGKPITLPNGDGFLMGWWDTKGCVSGKSRMTLTDTKFNIIRDMDIHTASHYTMGRRSDGRETFNMVQFDRGPKGSGVGSLVVFNTDDGTNYVAIGPSTGFLYPRADTHVSGTAFRNPGWIWASHVGGCNSSTYCPSANPPNDYQGKVAPVAPTGVDLLDNEITVTNVETRETCRVMHHRSHGKYNKVFKQPYWAEPHVTSSPSGTRAVFASDWGGGPTVDTYVIELPSYRAGTGPGRDSSASDSRNQGLPTPGPTSATGSASPSASGSPLRPTAAGPAASDPPASSSPSSSMSSLSSSGDAGFGVGGESGYSFAARPKGTASDTAASVKPARPFLSMPGAVSSTSSGNAPGTIATKSAADGASAAGTPTAATPLSRGIAELAAGHYESAESSLFEAVKSDPKSAAANYYLGYTYYLMAKQAPGNGDVARKASEYIAQAYRLDPGFKLATSPK